MANDIKHIPVMMKEILQHLNFSEGACVLDCTLGLGGHSREIAKKIGPQGLLIGIDRDEDSIALAQQNLEDFSGRCAFVQKDFRDLDVALDGLGISQVDGILFDLGVSSYQMDTAERGFSIRSVGPLDMRMDRNSFISAYDLINSLSSKEISLILKNFGEERWHDRIADHLVKSRVKHPIQSTEELTEIILKAIPRRFQDHHIHPATRTFQAFRIAVNRELEAIEIALKKAIRYLRPGGAICVISFHSLEDRIVKEKFKYFAKEQMLEIITKKPLRPTDEEIERNARSRSARLRVARRIKK
ncbi:MAG: 16S rRNA (cytosine(1402)-N(4))-methyltransferase RsmH [Candidatus Omnitrophica bacterium]|nr:16S rRNA (cytosine(1402)-N(4))-methyltransferase RsmH [Candidatus Omnitrophota bacterium]